MIAGHDDSKWFIASGVVVRRDWADNWHVGSLSFRKGGTPWCDNEPCDCGGVADSYRYYRGHEYGIECHSCEAQVAMPCGVGREAVAKVWWQMQDAMKGRVKP